MEDQEHGGRRLSAAELAETRREEITVAAVAVFAEHGYRDASIAQIAAQMGAGHGTIYRYFENKRAIAEHVLGRSLVRIAEALSAEPADLADNAEQYRAQVERIGRALYDLLIAEPELGTVIFFVAGEVDSEMREQVQRAFDIVAEVTATYLRNGITKGFLAPDIDAFRTGAAIVGMLFESARRVHLAEDKQIEGEHWVGVITKLMFDSVVKR